MYTDIQARGRIAVLEQLLEQNVERDEPLGFNRIEPDTMGVLELCVDGTTVLRIDGNRVYTTNNSGKFAYGTVYETDAEAREFAIYPSSIGYFYYYVSSTKFVRTALHKIALTNASGLQYVWFNKNGVLEVTTSFNSTYAFIASVYGNATAQAKIVFADERHGIQMDVATHLRLHSVDGTGWSSGAVINGLTSGGTTYSNISAGTFYDEDIIMHHAEQTNAPFWYINGTAWDILPDGVAIGYKTTGNCFYNQLVGASWQLTALGSAVNDYVLTHFLATNDCQFPYVKVIGQNVYTTATAARLGAIKEMYNLVMTGLPSAEFKFIGSVIVKGNGELLLTDLGDLYVDLRRERTK